mgnify:FL=1
MILKIPIPVIKRFVTHLVVMAQYKSEEFKIDRANCHIVKLSETID